MEKELVVVFKRRDMAYRIYKPDIYQTSANFKGGHN